MGKYEKIIEAWSFLEHYFYMPIKKPSEDDIKTEADVEESQTEP